MVLRLSSGWNCLAVLVVVVVVAVVAAAVVIAVASDAIDVADDSHCVDAAAIPIVRCCCQVQVFDANDNDNDFVVDFQACNKNTQ